MAHHHHHHTHKAEKNISIVFFLNLFFVFIEIVGGIITNSVSIISDAIHDIGDCLSLSVSWIMQKKSTKIRDRKYSYGYKRYPLLGSIFLSGMLCISSGFVLVKSCIRLFHPEAVNAHGMLYLAIAGIIINGVAALRIHSANSLNERAVYLHIMEDVLSWVAVLIVSLVMMFRNIPILDPILSIAISIWVLYNVLQNTKVTMKTMLQAVPEGLDLEMLNQNISSIDGVTSTHDLHVWSLDGESHVMTLHVVTTPEANKQLIRDNINAISLRQNIHHNTIEFENKGYICGMNCDKPPL